MLEPGEEEGIGQLIECQQIVTVTDHFGKFGPTGLLWHRSAGASQPTGRQARYGHLQASRYPGGAPRPAVQKWQIAVRAVASEELIAPRTRQSYRKPGSAD